MPRIRFAVRGRVQGVGFRWFVRRRALDLALAGWVRNEPWGGVSGEAEGTGPALEALGEALAAGPPGASVSDVQTEPVPEGRALPNPFEIW